MTPTPDTTTPARMFQRGELILSGSLIGLLVLFLVPLNTFLLDVFLSLNLAATVLVLLVTLTVKRPLDFSTFPSLLLLLTLFRLALNVATTRLILLDGNAGEVVLAFGQFVVGGNLVVGLIIFFILIVIQFIVITKGSSRVSEVSARFKLDALPGKQLAIDAELNAGLIDAAEAKKRRAALDRETEFFGTMDGASKFVRGDAIAAIIITAINLIAGIIIGLRKGMDASAAVNTYSILTIGDGLITQIPSLITSTAAGILVTKAASDRSLAIELGGQFRASASSFRLGAFVMLGLALVPGLPKLPFFVLAGVLYYLSTTVKPDAGVADEATPTPAGAAAEPAAQAQPRSPTETYVDGFLMNERLRLQIGNDLIQLLSTRQGPTLMDRIGTLRREVAKAGGLWMPTVHISDNRELEPEAYRVLIGGQEVARGQIRRDLWMAIDPAGGVVRIEGEEARDPVFGLPARWIPDADRQRAIMAGYTVVDAPSVLITHLGEVARKHAHELLSRDDLKELIDRVRTTSAALVDDLINPTVLTMGALHRVFTLLLEERVPVTNVTRILESLSANVPATRDPSELAERVRHDLGRAVCERFRDATGRLRAVLFDPRVEMELRRNTQNNRVNMDPAQQEALVLRLAAEMRTAAQRGYEVALLCDTSMRRAVRHVLARALGDLAVLAYQELPSDVLIETVAILKAEDLQGGPGTVAKMFG